MLVANGHKIEDIKYTYTIDQVYLFYEKCQKADLDKQYMEAVTFANALIYASPSYDQSSANKKQSMWRKFIDSLDWEALESKTKKKSDPLSMFIRAGIPVKKKGD